MLNGKIRSLNVDKGFGFIQPAAGGPDLFFHCSAVDAEFTALTLELPVEYEIDAGADKPRAKQVISGLAAAHPKPQQANAGYAGKSPGKQSSARPGNRHTSSYNTGSNNTSSNGGGYRVNSTGRGPGSSQRRPRPEIEYSFGYITKLPRKNPIGFISSTTGGREFYFEPEFVKGKKFTTLKVGDYVRFIPKPNPNNPKEPLAKAVEVVPKPINKQENNLKRHPKARRKKPTWKSR